MSELINNREQQTVEESERSKLLKEIFLDLYHGKSEAEVKARFEKEFIGEVTVEQVAQLSQLQRELVSSGNYSDEEIQRLSTAHMAILKERIKDQHRADEPGHPIHTFKLENREIEKLINTRLQVHAEAFEKEDSAENRYKLMEDCNLLLDIDKHYMRKEHLIFPYLEKYGIYGPSTNMWRMDDYIRDTIKGVKGKLAAYDGDKPSIMKDLDFIITQVSEMVFREENVLFPMALKNLTEDEWVKIAHESDKVGYCLTEPAAVWEPERKPLDEEAITEGFIKMETGVLSLKQLELVLNHLPVEITFIDHEDVVRYFSRGKERIFARTKAVLGRSVQNCHPPKSIHIVEQILDDFKSGKKDHEDFWIHFHNQYVYVRYFAVRDENGEYVGTIEFTQNIGPIQAIEGEKRILS